MTQEYPRGWTSLLVLCEGRVIEEAYADGDRDALRDTQAVGKSVLSLLVGVALDAGLLDGVDAAVLPVLSRERAGPGGGPLVNTALDPRWEGVTLRHLLTHTSGLPRTITDAAYDDAWWTSPDPVRFALAQPLADDPGGSWRYTNAGAQLLGEVLARAAGRPLRAWASDVLLGPLGVRPAWDADPTGRPFGVLHQRTRDLTRIGELVLAGGTHEGRRLVSAEWLAESTRPQTAADPGMEGSETYGYGWWTSPPYDGFFASGWGGQYLAIAPASRTVVAVTGETSAHDSLRPPRRVALGVIAERGHSVTWPVHVSHFGVDEDDDLAPGVPRPD